MTMEVSEMDHLTVHELISTTDGSEENGKYQEKLGFIGQRREHMNETSIFKCSFQKRTTTVTVQS